MTKPTQPSDDRTIQSGITSGPQLVCVAPDLTGKLIFFYEWCKKCGICAMVCPTVALEETPEKIPIMAHPEKCTLCSLCWRMCPDFAIVRNPNWEDKKNGTE